MGARLFFAWPRGQRVFPYERRMRWHLAHPTLHLIEATRTQLASLDAPYRAVAEARADTIPHWLKIRLALLLLLSPSLLATVSGAFLRILPLSADASDLVGLVVSVAGAAALLLGLAFLLVNRFIDQLEKDLIACLALGTSTTPPSRKKR